MRKRVGLLMILMLVSGFAFAEMPAVSGHWRNFSPVGNEQFVASEFNIRPMSSQEQLIYGLENEDLTHCVIIEETQKYFVLTSDYRLELKDSMTVTYNGMILRDDSSRDYIMAVFRANLPSMFYTISTDGNKMVLSSLMQSSLDGSLLKDKYSRF